MSSVSGASGGGEEGRYLRLTRNMTDVITCHGRNGAVLFASPTGESLFGIEAGNLLGQGLFDRVHVADRPSFLKAIADCAGSGENRSLEFRVRCEQGERPGTFIWIEMRCCALDHRPQSRNQRDREVVAVMRDITQRKEEEHAVAEARASAERANAAKGRFLATMSHELRTPLNAIIGFSEMLTKEESLCIDAKRRADYAQLINESGHHLLSVVNGILDMSKLETGNFEITPEPFALDELVEDCLGLLTLKAKEAGIEITTRIPKDLGDIVADKRSFSQLMLNLISNAIKFTRRGGNVQIGAEGVAERIAVTVEDNGVGIDPEELPRVGDPFFQARSSSERRYDGTGLGLSIVKGLLALHGGELEIESRLGEGTRVTVRLPRDCEAARKAVGPLPLPRTGALLDATIRKVKLSA
jgi:two-component system, cell cycle sensor histidine kinase DivJ